VTKIDLLRLEMATLWERDAFGRLRSHPLVAVAVAGDGVAVRFDPDLPPGLRKALEAVPIRGDFQPSIFDAYIRLVEPRFDLRISSGPSYVFPEHLKEIGGSDLTIVSSDDPVTAALAAGRPEAWWEPEEWEELLDGRLGLWAMGMIAGKVVSICHTPVGSSVAAEAGVWTHPDFRGREYAPRVAFAWEQVARRRFETLFYSTSSENSASQAVARKLGLTAIGKIWQIHASSEAK
jgi:RimJ/RimL family protein N-acetyltransferase